MQHVGVSVSHGYGHACIEMHICPRLFTYINYYPTANVEMLLVKTLFMRCNIFGGTDLLWTPLVQFKVCVLIKGGVLISGVVLGPCIVS